LNAMTQNAINEKLNLLGEKTSAMKNHEVFSKVKTQSDLQEFMEWHVFAVWDFMSLLKRLQKELTCTSLPWIPPQNSKASRLINEIVLGEESDETPSGEHTSHFELYLQAMRDVGASTTKINQYIELLRNGRSPEEALAEVDAPIAVRDFVMGTLTAACTGKIHETLGSFFYGREDSIPQMFQNLLDTWQVDPGEAPMFVFYLKRHIELDGDSHGPAAKTIISETLGNNLTNWNEMLDAAMDAVEQRVDLWNELSISLTSKSDVKVC
jgi:hypothetical protein